MKTFRELFEELDEPYRSQAIANTESEGFNVDQEFSDNLKQAVAQGFDWEQTPQGDIYWVNLYNSL